jgi:hypothetical protein
MFLCFYVQIIVSGDIASIVTGAIVNEHIPTYLGSRGIPFFSDKIFLFCLPIVD